MREDPLGTSCLPAPQRSSVDLDRPKRIPIIDHMKNRAPLLIVAVLLIGLFASACADRTPGSAKRNGSSGGPLRPMPTPSARQALEPLDRSASANPGEVQFLTALRTGSPGFESHAAFVKEQKIFIDLADMVNDLVPLKMDLRVLFKPCGEPTAFYSPDTDDITISGELIDFLDQHYAGPETERAESIRGAVYFVFLHELGHALIQRLDFPFTGREEDVADQFAVLLLLQQGEDGERAVLSGAQFFYDLAQDKAGQPLPFWDEHALEIQRFYNVACWIYGAYPFRYAGLVSSQILPAERAARAGDEFQKMHRNWKRLLDPLLKHPLN